MKFSENAVLFDIEGVPVIGNFDNGSIIGLTSEGLEFCRKVRSDGVSEDEISVSQKELFDALKAAHFFEDGQSAKEEHTMSAYLHLTQRCNLHCIGCYSLDCQRNRLADPSLEEVKRALDQLSENGCKLVVLSGGEPFLRKDLGEIVRYAKGKAGIAGIQIITNGTKVTSEMLKAVKPYVNGIAVSIDGYDEEHPTFIRDNGIFNSVVGAVELCRNSGIQTSILPTIHAKNYDRIPDYVTLSKKLGVQINFSLLTCSPMDEVLGRWLPDAEQLRTIAKEILEVGIDGTVAVNDMPIGGGIDARKSCEIGNKIVSVGADGTVYPCHMLHDPDLAMGNIFKTDLAEILNSETAKHCRSLHVDQFDTCKDCKHRYLCGGGCRARSYYVHKNLTSHDFYCPMTETYFDWISRNIHYMYSQKSMERRTTDAV